VPDASAATLASRTPPPLRRAPGARAAARTRRVIAVGGGKGGIGKSLVAASLAQELARRGEKVVLVDADLGGANLHTTLGIDLPRRTLSDFIEHRVERLDEVITPTGIPNLGLVSGAMDQLDAANPKHAQKLRLLRHLQSIDADCAVLDLGAGTHLNVLDFFLVSDHGVVVLVPEPTAVENVYRFLKAAFWRRVRNVAAVYGCEDEVRAVLGEGAFKSPVEVLRALSASCPDAGELLARELDGFRPRLVVNQARTPQDAEVGHAVIAAWRKFFGLRMDYLGHVEHDQELWRAQRARRALVQAPGSAAARAFAHIADRLAELDSARPRREDTP
jgi:flagellar biosynthesis protein FlhG